MTNRTRRLTGAFTRLERAREHIDEIQAMANRGDFDDLEVSVDAGTTGLVTDTSGPFDSDRVALLAGEAMYNLRVALDYLAWELCKLDGSTAPEELRAFPICASGKNFRAFVKRSLAGLAKVHRSMLRRWQPFNDHPLLAELDDRVQIEKHRHLVLAEPTAQITSVLSFETARSVKGLALISFIPLVPGEPYRPVRDALTAMLHEVEAVLKDFEPEFAA